MRDENIEKSLKDFLKNTDINEDKEFSQEEWSVLSNNILIVVEKLLEGKGKKVYKKVLSDMIALSNSLLRVLRERVCDLIVSIFKVFVV